MTELRKYESVNYGAARDREPILDATKHVEAAIPRLLFPEEISKLATVKNVFVESMKQGKAIGQG